MMRRGLFYTKPKSKGEKVKQNASLYRIKTVLIKDKSSLKTKHGTIYSEYSSNKDFKSWRDEFPKKSIFNGTTKPNKESIFIAKKLIKTPNGKGVVKEQYFRLYRIGGR